MPGDVEVNGAERIDNIVAVPDRALGDAVFKVTAEGCTSFVTAAGKGLWPGESRPCRIVRPRPAVFRIEGVMEGPEVALPTRRRDVQTAAALEVHPRRENVHVHSLRRVLVAVKDRGPGVAVLVDAGPSDFLEAIEGLLDLVAGGAVLRRPCEDGGRVTVFVLGAVGNQRDLVRIAAEHFHLVALRAGVITIGEKVVHRGRGAAGAVTEEADDHRFVGEGGRTSARARSISWSRVKTARASAAERWVLAHRASWFRLTPMRAT